MKGQRERKEAERRKPGMERRDRKRVRRRGLSVLLILAVLLLCAVSARAAETASVIRLVKTQGTVTVTNSSGKALTLSDNMRLLTGSHIKTGQASYAWISLDSKRSAKLDAASEVEIRTSGRNLEILVQSGSIFFDVEKPLEADETLNVRTSTMIAGIRGTAGWVRALSQSQSQLCVLEGTVRCTVPGTARSAVLGSGDVANLTAGTQRGAGIALAQVDVQDIAGFVLEDLASNPALVEKIQEKSGIDLRGVTPETVAARLAEDQARLLQAIQASGAGTGETGETGGTSGTGETGGTGRSGGSSGSGGTNPSQSREGTTASAQPSPSGQSRGGGSGGYQIPIQYRVTPCETEHGSVRPSAVFAVPGTSVALTVEAAEGYELDSLEAVCGETALTLSEEDGVPAFAMPVGNVSLRASFRPALHTVTLDANGGSVEPQTLETSVETAAELPVPVRRGYRFTGWNTERDGSGTACTGSLSASADMTLYAVWTPETYTVRWLDEDGTVLLERAYTYGELPDASAYDGETPAKAPDEGHSYTFDGWRRSGDLNVDYTAAYQAARRTREIWYDEDGETVLKSAYAEERQDCADPEKEEDERYTYTFAGWTHRTAENGDLLHTASYDRTPKACTVTYDANGGQGQMRPQTFQRGEKQALARNDFHRGYDAFTGWNTKADGSGTSYGNGAELTLTESLTLYAQWDVWDMYAVLYRGGAETAAAHNGNEGEDGDSGEDGAGWTLVFQQGDAARDEYGEVVQSWLVNPDGYQGVTDLSGIWAAFGEIPGMWTTFSEVPWYESREGIERVVIADTIRPRSTAYWFQLLENLSSVEGLDRLDTSAVTSMVGMFDRCAALSELDVTGFDTAHVTDMTGMFHSCTGLTELDVTGFDTSAVTQMGGMFRGCSSLTELDVTGFDTSGVLNMILLFSDCTGLTELDVTGFDTSAATLTGGMFRNCSGLTELDVSGFDTSRVTNLSRMFSGCGKLAVIYASDSFRMDAVTDDSGMFAGCRALRGGQGTAWDADHTDGAYARLDGGPEAPGYFSPAD